MVLLTQDGGVLTRKENNMSNLELAPDFIQGIDWEEFKSQREELYKVAEGNEKLEGIISVLDGICDYAVDFCGLEDTDIFLQGEL